MPRGPAGLHLKAWRVALGARAAIGGASPIGNINWRFGRQFETINHRPITAGN